MLLQPLSVVAEDISSEVIESNEEETIEEENSQTDVLAESEIIVETTIDTEMAVCSGIMERQVCG